MKSKKLIKSENGPIFKKLVKLTAKKNSCMNTDDVYKKTIHVPVIIETDEDLSLHRILPTVQRLATHSVKLLMRHLPV